MNTNGMIGALLIVPMLATLGGCVAPGGQQQNFGSTQATSANSPCTPTATDSLISTGRSLLSIANSVMEAKQSFDGNSATYAQRVQAAQNTQKLNKGHEVLNNVAGISGTSNAPCTAAAQTSAAR